MMLMKKKFWVMAWIAVVIQSLFACVGLYFVLKMTNLYPRQAFALGILIEVLLIGGIFITIGVLNSNLIDYYKKSSELQKDIDRKNNNNFTS